MQTITWIYLFNFAGSDMLTYALYFLSIEFI